MRAFYTKDYNIFITPSQEKMYCILKKNILKYICKVKDSQSQLSSKRGGIFMPRLSDIIEEFIKQLIEKKDGEVEIQRNELANFFNCAPSQINYVLSTRFTIERGYYIESKRGGGGSIRIVKVKFENSSNLLENILNNINSPVSQHQANEIVECLLENGAISKREASIMKAALNDKTLPVNQPLKDTLRMLILKAMIISLMNG